MNQNAIFPPLGLRDREVLVVGEGEPALHRPALPKGKLARSSSPFAGTARRWRRAMSLIETSIVLIVTIGALAAGANIFGTYLKGQTNHVAAQQLLEVSRAFSKYLVEQVTTVESLVPNAAGAVVEIPLATLQPSYLSASFVNRNAFGQSYALAVRRPAAGSNNLEAIVYTRGGDQIDPSQGLSIAQEVGMSGGFTLKGGSATQVRSTLNGYNLDLGTFNATPGGSGKLVNALFLNDLVSLNAQYLYRNAVAGHPELNQMNTALAMANNDISGAGQVGARRVQTTQDAAIGTGLTVGTNLTVAGTTSSTGVVAGRLQVNQDASVGTTLGVGSNLNVNGSTTTAGETYTGGWFRTTGDTGWYSQKWGGGWYMADGTWIRAYNNKNVYTPGTMEAGALQSDGRLTANEFVQINGQELLALVVGLTAYREGIAPGCCSRVRTAFGKVLAG